MGGATRYGNFKTRKAASNHLKELREAYEIKYGLFLKESVISYNPATKRWDLSVRFTK